MQHNRPTPVVFMDTIEAQSHRITMHEYIAARWFELGGPTDSSLNLEVRSFSRDDPTGYGLILRPVAE